jgi:hypothetical protein
MASINVCLSKYHKSLCKITVPHIWTNAQDTAHGTGLRTVDTGSVGMRIVHGRSTAFHGVRPVSARIVGRWILFQYSSSLANRLVGVHHV